MGLDAQQMHNRLMARRRRAIKKNMSKNKNDKNLEKLMQIDPISAACANNPGLSPERAAEIAEAFGF
jgi:tRNA A37 N6-isopentenylltransferase MiaA